MLRFSLGDVPVRVHVTFLLIAFIYPAETIPEYVAWVLVAFLAVLFHEAGHAFAARRYGADPVTITLFALGGVTMYPATKEMTAPRRLVISAMGSIVGIVSGGLLLLIVRTGMFDGSNDVVVTAVNGFIWASLGWGLLNWIPIRPLDGGAMVTSFLEIVWPRRALLVAKIVSLVFGVTAAYLLYRMGSNFGAVFVLFIMAMGLASGEPTPEDDDDESVETEIVEPERRRTTEDAPPEFPI